MLSRTITARGAGCSSRGWSSDCKPATQTTPNAPAIRHASASLRPHTAHPATRRMQILVDRDEPVPLRRAHAPRATLDGRHCRPAMRRPGEARGAQTVSEDPRDKTRKNDGFTPGPSVPQRPRCPVYWECARAHFRVERWWSGCAVVSCARASQMQQCW